jgi:tetratricopeptide (TPR) repeat protein
LKAKPQAAPIIDSKAFVLYQLGRYQEALDTYNQALAINPAQAASLYVRGHTKHKLGDTAGGDADIAAAKALDGDVQSTFTSAGLPAD